MIIIDEIINKLSEIHNENKDIEINTIIMNRKIINELLKEFLDKNIILYYEKRTLLGLRIIISDDVEDFKFAKIIE